MSFCANHAVTAVRHGPARQRRIARDTVRLNTPSAPQSVCELGNVRRMNAALARRACRPHRASSPNPSPIYCTPIRGTSVATWADLPDGPGHGPLPQVARRDTYGCVDEADREARPHVEIFDLSARNLACHEDPARSEDSGISVAASSRDEVGDLDVDLRRDSELDRRRHSTCNGAGRR